VTGVPRRVTDTALSVGIGDLPEVGIRPTRLPLPAQQQLLSGQMLPALSAAMSAGAPLDVARLQGVDLRLDQFDLSEVKRVSLEAQAGSWGSEAKALDECVEMGSAFFECLDGSHKLFKDDDLALLKNVFNPALADRRSEGDLFIPPDASYSHVQKLRELVKEEETVQERRKELFFSVDFLMGDPGRNFPRSWTPTFEITHGRRSIPAPEGQSQGVLHLRPEYKDQTLLLDCALKTSAPIFDKCTEEGLRFRIYRAGSLEVRTTQEREGREIVGAVFSIRSKAPKAGSKAIGVQEKISKVVEYVENAFDAGSDRSLLGCHYYLVLETMDGNRIVTERLGDGQLTWVEDPEDLDDRNSLAKVTRCDALDTGITVEELQAYRAKLAEGVAPSSKRYAQAILVRAVGARRVAAARPNIQEFAFWRPSGQGAKDVKAVKECAKNRSSPQDDGPSVFALPNRSLRPPLQIQGF